MFCSKCGKEIDDTAVVCIGCGCPTKNYTVSTTNESSVPKQYSSFNEASNTTTALVRQYTDCVKSIYVCSLLSLLFCLGIGFIFGIIALNKINNLPKIDGDITDPIEVAEYQSAVRKVGTSRKMIAIGIMIFLIATIIMIPIMIGAL